MVESSKRVKPWRRQIAAAYADHICAMKDGRIAEFGTPEAIMRDGVLSTIFNTDITVMAGPNGRPVAVYF